MASGRDARGRFRDARSRPRRADRSEGADPGTLFLLPGCRRAHRHDPPRGRRRGRAARNPRADRGGRSASVTWRCRDFAIRGERARPAESVGRGIALPWGLGWAVLSRRIGFVLLTLPLFFLLLPAGQVLLALLVLVIGFRQLVAL